MTTEDGAMLSPHDPVTLLLSYREVTGLVNSWKTHPVTERYKEVCSQLGVGESLVLFVKTTNVFVCLKCIRYESLTIARTLTNFHRTKGKILAEKKCL